MGICFDCDDKNIDGFDDGEIVGHRTDAKDHKY